MKYCDLTKSMKIYHVIKSFALNLIHCCAFCKLIEKIDVDNINQNNLSKSILGIRLLNKEINET